MLRKRSGFTLVEILVALALAGLVSVAIFNVYISQNKSYAVQDRVAEMQQNLRAANYMMRREIMMAGYNPLRTAGVGIVSASATQLQFTMDITGGEADGLDNDLDGLTDEEGESDGDAVDTNEDITYQLNGSNLERNGQVLAENIDALNFVYLDAGGGVLDLVANPGDITEIRSIQLSLVARADFGDPDYTNNNAYSNQNPDGPEIILAASGDHFRRRLSTTQVRCRNLGL
ncbi:MAG: prepilin-type N-terminal cleavage/methylation domain-containing protein [Deltaproteobacteria bacterium]|nr:prepilin-type N-terminal cleavage/methylation domain-containing protein [Deltaproteobacteria bacterium]